MKKNVTFYFRLMTILSFAGGILLFTNDSAFADKHNLGTAYTVVGIGLLLGATYCLYKVMTLAKPNDERAQ